MRQEGDLRPPTPDEVFYFAYGSNLHPARLEARVGRAHLVTTAELSAFELRFDKRGQDGSGKCNIAESLDSKSVVHGAVYRLTSVQMEALDDYEALGAGYCHASLEVRTPTGMLAVKTYRAMPDYVDPSRPPYGWYRDLVADGARYHDFPQTYLDMLRAQRVIDDPDGNRVQINATLLSRMSDG